MMGECNLCLLPESQIFHKDFIYQKRSDPAGAQAITSASKRQYQALMWELNGQAADIRGISISQLCSILFLDFPDLLPICFSSIRLSSDCDSIKDNEIYSFTSASCIYTSLAANKVSWNLTTAFMRTGDCCCIIIETRQRNKGYTGNKGNKEQRFIKVALQNEGLVMNWEKRKEDWNQRANIKNMIVFLFQRALYSLSKKQTKKKMHPTNPDFTIGWSNYMKYCCSI